MKMEVSFKLTPEQIRLAERIKRQGGVYQWYLGKEDPTWAGNLLGNAKMGNEASSQYLSLLDAGVVVYKGTQNSLFQYGGGAVLAYIASGLDDFCYNGIKIWPKTLTDEMSRYLPVLTVTSYKPTELGFLWYERKPPEENRFEGLVDW